MEKRALQKIPENPVTVATEGGWVAGWSFRRVVREPPRRHLSRGSP